MRRLVLLAALAVAAGIALARRRGRPAAGLAPPPPSGGGLAAAPSARATDERFVSVAWTLAAPPGERAELRIECHQDDALVLDRVDVQETPTQVFVTAIARRERAAAGDPPRGAASATVALSSPLGERELIPTPVDPYP